MFSVFHSYFSFLFFKSIVSLSFNYKNCHFFL
ncbi:hypothetical protein CoNPh11_CDS0232 [Staphylococcus phage S-CoN_Ph11]|nr:hypothetical protein CoNPh6_CDS0164 [Staphylococcus phage S-CoN_Ph6]WNM53289.1 hypothetical protein CoNPh11_CDS0232 [Staphylococcus phage S-CoN_Ph11]